MGNIKIRRKSMKRDIQPTLNIRIISIFSSFSTKEQSFIFRKICRTEFSNWLSKFFPLIPCLYSQKSNCAQNENRLALYPFVMQIFCRVISSGPCRNPNFDVIGRTEIFRRAQGMASQHVTVRCLAAIITSKISARKAK